MKRKLNARQITLISLICALICAVIAVFACVSLSDFNNKSTADENATTIQAPEHVAKPQHSGGRGYIVFDSPSIAEASGDNLVSFTSTNVVVKVIGSATSVIEIQLTDDGYWYSGEELGGYYGYPGKPEFFGDACSLVTDLPSGVVSTDGDNRFYITNIDKMVANKQYKIGISLNELWNSDADSIRVYWSDTKTQETRYIYITKQGQEQTPSISPSGTSTITYNSTLQLTGSGEGALSWKAVACTHLRADETPEQSVCRLLR